LRCNARVEGDLNLLPERIEAIPLNRVDDINEIIRLERVDNVDGLVVLEDRTFATCFLGRANRNTYIASERHQAIS
jgi:hypothetical protein